MSEPRIPRRPHDEFGHMVERRISIRAAYLRSVVEREAEALSDKLRLVLALEEIGTRLQAGGEITGEDARWIFCATGGSDENMTIGAHHADGRLKLEGRAEDAFLPNTPYPDEARVLQVLLRLREIPHLSGKDIATAMEKVLQIAALAKNGGQHS